MFWTDLKRGGSESCSLAKLGGIILDLNNQFYLSFFFLMLRFLLLSSILAELCSMFLTNLKKSTICISLSSSFPKTSIPIIILIFTIHLYNHYQMDNLHGTSSTLSRQQSC